MGQQDRMAVQLKNFHDFRKEIGDAVKSWKHSGEVELSLLNAQLDTNELAKLDSTGPVLLHVVQPEKPSFVSLCLFAWTDF
jgi:hypothetical protein